SPVIIASRLYQRIEKRGLAIRTEAVNEEHGVLGRKSRERIARHPLQILNQLLLFASNPVEERAPIPRRAFSIRCYPGDLCHVGGAVMLAQFTRTKIDNPRWRVQFPKVRVPLLDSRDQAPVALCQILNGRRGFLAGNLLRNSRLVAFVAFYSA